MKLNGFVIVILIALSVYCTGQSLASEDDKNTLSVVLMLDTEKAAQSYTQIIDQFALDHPDLDIDVKYYKDTIYKTSIETWLRNGDYDLLYWQAGLNRIQQLVDKGLLADLSYLWHSEKLSQKLYTNLEPMVTFGEKVMAVPISYYHWGLFYNKNLFNELSLSPPSTWDELLNVCSVMDKAGVIPVGMGVKDKWPILAWFSYIALRSYDVDFYQQLMEGKISWQDDRVKTVMKRWRTLLEVCYISKDPGSYDWRLPSRSLARKQVGMVLSGNYIMQLYTDTASKQIDYFPFPKINPAVPVTEVSPVEVWVASSRAKNLPQAEQLIRFFMRPSSLTKFNYSIEYLSPHKASPLPDDPIKQQGIAQLDSAQNLTSYFDRDAAPEIVDLAQDVFIDFLQNQEIEPALERLESLRKLVYGDISEPGE